MVDAKVRRGDWEGDIVIGEKHQSGLVTLVERKSQDLPIETVAHKSASEVTEAILRWAGKH
jgi:IS30 family transposase